MGLRSRLRRGTSRDSGAPPAPDAPALSGTAGPLAPVVPVLGVRSDEVRLELEQSGFARLGPFLNAAEVRECLAVFEDAMDRLDQPLGDEWFPTILLPDDDVRGLIDRGLQRVISPKLDDVFDANVVRLMRLDYSVKPAGPRSELGPHQDFSLVDETTATSLYVWIPLCDTTAANGTLHVVPGSHRFGNRIRSRHVPAVFDEVLDLVHEQSLPLECRAGELIVMVSGVVHHSPPNLSGTLRVAAHGIVVPLDAPLVFFYADDSTPSGRIECYELDLERYVQQIHQGRPAADVALSRLVDRPEGSMSRERFLGGMASIDSVGGDAPPA